MVDQKVDTRSKLLANQIDSIADSLEVMNNDVATLPERLFVNVFLRFFAGEDVPEKEKIMQAWINTAGNQYKPIDVLNEKGEVIYRVPALFDRETHVASLQNTGAPSIADVVKTAEQISRNSPRQAQHFLNHHFKGRLSNNNERVRSHAMESLIFWNSIFARYNKPLIVVPGLNENEVATTAQAATGKANLVYDDDDLL